MAAAMMSNTPLPHTIDQVIARLDLIIDDAARGGSRLGYFAALYNRVTITVRDGIRAGAFADNERMERLDVAFANRYLAAYDAHAAGATPTGAWALAFEATRLDSLSVLQHLFLGMNAHIHLDLGIASSDTAGSLPIDALERDFHHINDVLASLVPLVEEELGEITHRFTSLPHLAHGLDRRVVNFSMAQARRDAWHFAVALSRVTDPSARAEAVARRDHDTVSIGRLFQRSGMMASIFGGADTTQVREHIRVLARGEYGLPANL